MSNQIITSDLLKEDPDLIDLIDRFITRLPEMTEAIMNAGMDESWDMFTDLVHQLKGVGGNYGYPVLTEICVVIEAGLREKNYAEVKNLLSDFKIMSDSILAGNDENHKIAVGNK